jgi:hypothetical protein
MLEDNQNLYANKYFNKSGVSMEVAERARK